VSPSEFKGRYKFDDSKKSREILEMPVCASPNSFNERFIFEEESEKTGVVFIIGILCFPFSSFGNNVGECELFIPPERQSKANVPELATCGTYVDDVGTIEYGWSRYHFSMSVRVWKVGENHTQHLDRDIYET